MIRQPSSTDQLLSWHRDFIAGLNPPRHDGCPQVGWYKTQLVKNGPWIPVTVWCDRDIDPETGELTCDEVLRADVFGEEKPVNEIWNWLTPITREEFNHLNEWRLRNQHRYESRRSIDLTETPTLPRSA